MKKMPDEEILDTLYRMLNNQDNTLAHSYIAPILKPNKNRFLPENYRHVILLSAWRKLLSKIRYSNAKTSFWCQHVERFQSVSEWEEHLRKNKKSKSRKDFPRTQVTCKNLKNWFKCQNFETIDMSQRYTDSNLCLVDLSERYTDTIFAWSTK